MLKAAMIVNLQGLTPELTFRRPSSSTTSVGPITPFLIGFWPKKKGRIDYKLKEYNNKYSGE